MHDGVAGISRGEQDFDAGPPPGRLVAELAAVHAARQSDIGEQKTKLGVSVQHLESRESVRSA